MNTRPLNGSQLIKDLYNASQAGNLATVNELLAIPEVVEHLTMPLDIEWSAMVPPSNWMTPFAILNAAIINGHEDIVKAIMDKVPGGMESLDASAINQIASSAVMSPNPKVLEFLLSVPVIAQEISTTTGSVPYADKLWLAVTNGKIGNVNRLMDIPALNSTSNILQVLKDTLNIFELYSRPLEDDIEYDIFGEIIKNQTRKIATDIDIKLTQKLIEATKKQNVDLESGLTPVEREVLEHHSKPRASLFYLLMQQVDLSDNDPVAESSGVGSFFKP